MTTLLPPAWSSRLALLSGALLALVVVWLSVRLLWLMIGGVSVESAPALDVPRMTQASGNSGEFRWGLFGRSASAGVMLQPLPVADSRLKLKGVMAGRRGYAIIAADGVGQSVYRRGEKLPDGAEIESIEARSVVIVRDGRRESLMLDSDTAGSGRQRQAGADNGRNAVRSGRALPGIRGFSAASGASVASLPDAARSMGLDVDELAQSVSVMPVTGGGFRVRPGRNAQLFEQLGLQVNDVVVAVNGQPLESAQAVRRLFGEVMSSGQAAITVRRDGREVTLQPDLEQIMGSLQSR